jgi:hypothetical protein
MKLAIMQPYFFPYLGYFGLIKHTDHFILFDTPQYIRHGWIERNRILKQNGEPLYIKVPLKKHARDTAINKIIVNNSENWKEKIFAQLVPYKRAPYYRAAILLLKEIFDFNSESIVEINSRSLKMTCKYLGISTPVTTWSDMGLAINSANAADEWALNICKAMGANTYYNPIGGVSFFDKSKYEKNGIEIKFMEIQPTRYNQLSKEFIPFLSIIDVIMYNSPGDINEMLDSYELK